MRKRLGFALGLLALVFAATAAFAAGGGGPSIVKHTTTADDEFTTQRAKCGRHKHVLGGGFSIPAGDNLAQQDNPGRKRAWRVETLTSPGDEVSAYAICERASRRTIDKVSKSVTVPSPGGSPASKRGVILPSVVERSVVATCDRGWEVISGGYAVVPPYDGVGEDGEIAVDTSMRSSSRKWKVHGGNDGDPTDLVAFALCQKKGESEIDQRSKTTNVTAPGVHTAKAKCPRGSHLVGGGFQSVPDEAGGNFPHVSASKPLSGQRWKATYTPGTEGSITSFAECEHG